MIRSLNCFFVTPPFRPSLRKAQKNGRAARCILRWALGVETNAPLLELHIEQESRIGKGVWVIWYVATVVQPKAPSKRMLRIVQISATALTEPVKTNAADRF